MRKFKLKEYYGIVQVSIETMDEIMTIVETCTENKCRVVFRYNDMIDFITGDDPIEMVRSIWIFERV